MIFSLKHKFIFIRNPACANRSISKALEPFSFEYEKKGFGFKHCTYMKQKSSDIFNVSEIFGDDFFVFSGVRNPWERAYNLFEGQRIMNVVEKEFTNRLDRSVTDWNAKNKTINDNLKNLTDDALLMLNQKDYRVGVDFVYRFENLQNDFDYICDRLKINTRLPSKEESYSGIDFKDESYREHFDKESIDIISKINIDDIKEYGYEF